jgi:hypothetical protein
MKSFKRILNIRINGKQNTPLINDTKILIDKLSRPNKLKLKDLLQVPRDFVVEML